MPKRRYDNVVGKCFVGSTSECLLCGYKTSSETGIKLHMKVKHNTNNCLSSKCPTCYACRKDFKNYGALIDHLKKEHY